jgi:hypothetical protein
MIEKSNDLMLLHEGRDSECMYSTYILKIFQNSHLIHAILKGSI